MSSAGVQFSASAIIGDTLMKFVGLDGRAILTAALLGLSLGLAAYAAVRVLPPPPVPDEPATEQVLVARHSLPAHAKIGDLDVISAKVSPSKVLPAVLRSSLELSSNRQLIVPVTSGQQITEYMLEPD